MYTVFTHERAGRLTRPQKEYVLEQACQELDARIVGWGLGKERFFAAIHESAAAGDVPVLFTGDTTFGEAAAAVDQGSTLGYLPGGTGCFMGFVIGYPRPYAKHLGDLFGVPDALTLRGVRSYLGRAARRIKDGSDHPHDMIMHDSGRRLLMASIGFDPRVLIAREKHKQDGYGHGTSYGLAMRDVMLGFRGIDATVEIDGRRLERSDVATVLVTKVQYYGLGLRMAPYAKGDDGLLHVRILPRSAIGEALRSCMSGIYAGEHAAGGQVRISTEAPEPIQFDGDLFGERLINEFSVLRHRIKLRY